MKIIVKKYLLSLPWHRNIFLLLATLSIMCLALPVITLPLHIVHDVNEGWNAYLTHRAISADPHLPLYPPAGSMIFNNYPPLSFLIIGALSTLIHTDPLFVGRVISLLSLCICSTLIGLIVHRITHNAPASYTASFLFLITSCTVAPSYIGMNDPQWFGQALMLGALSLIMCGSPSLQPSHTQIALAALFVVASILTKHNVVACPLALTVWFILRDRRALVTWICVGLSAALVTLYVLVNQYGIVMFEDIFLHHRFMALHRITHILSDFAMMGGLLVGWGLLLKTNTPSDDRQKKARFLVTIYVLFSTALGCFFRLGKGVDINAFFDTLIATSLASGFFLAKSTSPRLFVQKLAYLSFPLWILLPWLFFHNGQTLAQLPQTQKEWNTTIAFIHNTPGRVACSELALCYWAHKAEETDTSNLFMSFVTGHHNYPLHNDVMHHHFALVEARGTASHYSTGYAPYDNWLATAQYRPVFTRGDGVVFLSPAPSHIETPAP